MAAPKSADGTPLTGLDAMMADPTFWASVCVVVFLALLWWKAIPSKIAKSLDDRAQKIADELDNARKLREEAQKALADAERRQNEAESEAEEIVAAARREAKDITELARKELAERVARREKLAEERIARAETEAAQSVRAAAAEAASKAAERLMTDAMKSQGADAFTKSLDEIKRTLS